MSAAIAALAAEIQRHDALYHGAGRPEINDAAYDALVAQAEALAALAGQALPRRVGAPPAAGATKVKHTVPMLSLDKARSADETALFFDRLARALGGRRRPADAWAEIKVDGLACSLLYERGRLVRAATRGDGQTGEDVTAQVRGAAGVPERLRDVPDRLEIRGEVYVRRADLAMLNAAEQAAGRAPYATARAAAAASLRTRDASVAASRPLRFVAYGLGDASARPADTHSGLRDWLRDAGFEVVEPARRVRSAGEAEAFLADLEGRRETLGFDADGVVLKADLLAVQDALGSSATAPRWALARKFCSALAIATVRAVEVKTGKTGRQTPVLHLEPVRLGSVKVSRVSVPSYDAFVAAGIGVGARVRVLLVGDAAPVFDGVFERGEAPAQTITAAPAPASPRLDLRAFRRPLEPIRLTAHERLAHAEILERLRVMAEALEDAKARRRRQDLPEAARDMAQRRCRLFPWRLLEEGKALRIGGQEPLFVEADLTGVVRLVYPAAEEGQPARYLDVLGGGR